ncbi:hypothetical protein AAHC03_09715 [Spirometra sp. Aus1]
MKRTWTELRSEARTLESEIDTKLAEYGRLGGGAPNVPRSDWMQEYNASTDKLRDLLNRLESLIAQMAGRPQHASWSYAIQRYREIFLDYKQEFRRLRENLLANRERWELLRTVRCDSDSLRIANERGPRSELEGEQASLLSAHRMLDEQLQASRDIHLEMSNQGSHIHASRGRLFESPLKRFSAINRLLTSITLRESRDALILGLVVGFCILLSLFYLFR